ncbi:hypothetical protein H072_1758 [Dactylellina haptotyla CBS 200.50]|uniref:NmrA-like domain-containing protein n=1 Tax=Dactylellina haptotyla (strain CBS 200.50) TaxID=1284197 RepID=S8BXI8_DACHA|nr:hypothetical protein H072_1758 [Dactylellina haptotyla CBS 200.50]
MSKTILISGVTGKQGGALLQALQSYPEYSSLSIRAIVRDPAAASQKFGSAGISFHKANLTDKASLESAMAGVDTAFLVTIPRPNAEAEVTQGKTFIDAAKAAGVKYIVFSSVGSAERDTGVPHFDSKREVEKYLADSGIAYSIIRPVAFMDGLPLQGAGRFFALGIFKATLKGNKIQLIAVKDIGIWLAKAIMDPQGWKSKEVELAGDNLNVTEILDVYEKVQGSRPWVAWLPLFLINLMLPKDFSLMFKFFREDGYRANIPELKKTHPELMSFEDYLLESSKKTN